MFLSVVLELIRKNEGDRANDLTSPSHGAIPLNWDKGSSCLSFLFVCLFVFFFLIYETLVSAPTADLLACSTGVFFGRANVFARESAMLKLQKRRGNGSLFLLSPIFLCHKIKDGGYDNTNINKQLSPPQNTPALQAADLPLSRHALYQPTNHWPVVKTQFKRHENANLGTCLYEVVTKRP